MKKILFAGLLMAAALQSFAANLPVPEGCPPDPESLDDAWRFASPHRLRISLNGLWRARPVEEDREGRIASDLPEDDWGWARVPGFLCKYGLGAAYYDDTPVHLAPRFSGGNLPTNANERLWFRRTFTMPREAQDRRVALVFEHLSTRAEIWVDGARAGRIDWPARELDISAFAKPGAAQTFHVLLTCPYPDEWQSEWSEAFMGATADMVWKVSKPRKIDSRGFLGDAWLDLGPKGERATFGWGEFLLDGKTATFVLETEGLVDGRTYGLEVTARPTWGDAAPLRLRATDLSPDAQGCLRLSTPWPDVALWDPDTPHHLYEVSMALLGADGTALDELPPFETGFREVRLAGKDVLLNGRPMHLRTTLYSEESRPCLTTRAGATEFCSRIRAMNFNSFNMNTAYIPGSPSFEEVYRAADHAGMLVMDAVVPRISDPPLDKNALWRTPAMQQLFRARAELAVRAVRRHPSVVLYKMNMNMTGETYAEFPQHLATNEPAPGADERDVRKSALWSAACVNAIDPTRPAYNHDSGTLGDFTTKNIYLGWAPPRERADWMEGWAKTGVKPVNWCEYGTPDISRFQSFRRPYFIYRTPCWQRDTVAESAAEWLGEGAFRDDAPTRRAMLAEDAHFAGGSRVFQRGGLQGAVDGQWLQISEVMGLFWGETLKGFRGWGLHGVLPWCWNKLYHYKIASGRHRNPDAWKGLKEPGLTVEWISGEMRYGAQYPESSIGIFPEKPWEEIFELTAYGEAQRRWSAPAIGFIGGDEPFTDRRANYAVREAVRKRLVLVSDHAAPAKCRWAWRAFRVEDGDARRPATPERAAFGDSGETEVPPGGRADAVFSFTPATAGRWRIEASFAFGDEEPQRDAFDLNVLPPAPVPEKAVALFDPKGLTKREFDRLGIPYAEIQATAASLRHCAERTVVVGRECLTRELWDGAIVPAAVAGKDVILFEQAKGDLEDIGFRVQERGMRQGFARYREREMAECLDDARLHDWAGASTLADPDWAVAPDVPRDRLGRPTQLWAGYAMTRAPRANNRGCVATILPEKPHVGDWRPLVDGLFALEHAPLLEMRTGAGSVTLCQLDVTARTVPDPAADAILARLVSYRRGGVGPNRPAFLGREAEMAGYNWGVKSWENCADLVVSPGAEVPEDLEERVAGGATILCLGLGADEARAWSCGEALDIAPTNGCTFSRIEAPPPELNGLSNADFFWHGAMDFAAFQEPRSDGNAAFRIVRHGKGRIVYWQLPPWRFDTDAKPHQRPSRRAASRVLARLLCNLGWETFTDGTGFHKRPQYKDVPIPEDDPYVWVNL